MINNGFLVRPEAIACGADLCFSPDVFLVRPKTIVFRRTYVLRMMFIFFSPPENDSFRKDLCFTHDVYFIFFSEHEISEMRGPTGLKFCTMVSTRLNFIMPVQNFWGRTPKKCRGEKHAKFGPISDDFEVQRRISPKGMKMFKIG